MDDSEYFEQKNTDFEVDSGVEITDLDAPEDIENSRLLRFVDTLFGRQLSPGKQFMRQAMILCSLLFVVLVIVLGLQSGLAAMSTGKLSNSLASSSSIRQVSGHGKLTAVKPGSARGSLACLINSAWSPDSKHIAVLSYEKDCLQDSGGAEVGSVFIYDGHTGKKVRQLHPDDTILQVLHQRYEGGIWIYYHNVLWSPDGRRLAILFDVALPAAMTDGLVGVLLIDPNNEHTHPVVMLQDNVASYTYLVWDLASGAPAQITYTIPMSPAYATNVPPALGYHWGTRGSLIPEVPLTTTTAPFVSLPGPIGNPDGGASFSIWQTGVVQLTTQFGNSPTHIPGVYSWQSEFAAWSPDGRYLVESVSLVSRLIVPGRMPADHQTLVDFQMERLPLLTARDVGLEQLLEGLSLTSPGTSWMEVSWSPDGRFLATSSDNSVDLYDSATGERLDSVHPKSTSESGRWDGVGIILRWSPDSSHLLISGSQWGPATIWEAGQLAK